MEIQKIHLFRPTKTAHDDKRFTVDAFNFLWNKIIESLIFSKVILN